MKHTFNAYVKDEGQLKHVSIDGSLVSLPFGFVGVVHPEWKAKGWSVSDPFSGFSFATGTTKKDAIAKARETVANVGLKKCQDAIIQSINSKTKK